jgi:hypothetical protein
LEELYSDLPVVFIDNYEDISEEFLVRKYEEILDKSFNFNKIKFRNDFYKKSKKPIEQAFRRYIPNK